MERDLRNIASYIDVVMVGPVLKKNAYRLTNIRIILKSFLLI